MSKVKLLIDVISDLRSLAESLQAIANVMTENESSATVDSTTQDVVENKSATGLDATASGKVKQEKKSSKKAATKKQYTLEEVRGILAEKSQNGLTAEVKALIEKYGGNKLSDIKPENYAAMIKEAKVLGSE